MGVGAIGLIFIEVCLELFVNILGYNGIASLIVFLECSILINFVLNDRYTFKADKQFSLRTRFTIFQGQALITRGLNVGIYVVLLLALNPVLAELAAVVLAFGGNYLLGKHVTWRRGKRASSHLLTPDAV